MLPVAKSDVDESMMPSITRSPMDRSYMTCREEIQDLLCSGTLGLPLGIERPQSHDPFVAEC